MLASTSSIDSFLSAVLFIEFVSQDPKLLPLGTLWSLRRDILMSGIFSSGYSPYSSSKGILSFNGEFIGIFSPSSWAGYSAIGANFENYLPPRVDILCINLGALACDIYLNIFVKLDFFPRLIMRSIPSAGTYSSSGLTKIPRSSTNYAVSGILLLLPLIHAI